MFNDNNGNQPGGFNTGNNGFNNDNNGGGDFRSERERLGIDADGKNVGKQRQQRDKDRYDQYNNNNYNQRGGRFGGRFGRNRGGGGEHNLAYAISAIVGILLVIGIPIYLVIGYHNNTLPEWARSMFASPFENGRDLQQSVVHLGKINENNDKDTADKVSATWYDKNNIYNADALKKQVYPEYMVFLYTGNATTDSAWNKWIKSYEDGTGAYKDNKDAGKYKIYKIQVNRVANNTTDSEAADYAGTFGAMMFIVNTPTKNNKELDSVIKNASQLKRIPSYMDDMVAKASADPSFNPQKNAAGY